LPVGLRGLRLTLTVLAITLRVLDLVTGIDQMQVYSIIIA